MVSRADERAFAQWWWTVDRVLLGALLSLIALGVLLSLAASPPVAEKLGVGSYHFVIRHAMFAVPAVIALITFSFLSPRQVRRVALVIFAVALVGIIVTLFMGVEVKGSRRWIQIAGLTVQPAEFVKPAFVILTAFLFAEGSKRADLPGRLLAVFLLAMVIAPLIAQPDFGQAMLIAIVWSAMIFLAGLQWRWVFALGGLGFGGIVSAYLYLPHVTARFNAFLDPSSDKNYQINRSIESFIRGGWFGEGPGEGIIKRRLPDSHTDFVFAVTAEEFGILACGLLVLLFAVVVLRGLMHAFKEPDPFVRLALSGLMLLFGGQAAINMAVNLQLMPAKGMTLPFISYGGSSLMAVALEMGLALALARRRPRPVRFTTERSMREAFA
ncbi:FtsW/RodA/SpoVE family cell cycle protein [Acuticoccus mangrovi]|uniref:Probable peptidoglycan glycosyltransferase FtsW n=1 Tax=Acuticoccus mangrovi TaxID=2796142 RepID=A0A934MGG1_9HYPH|nr:putative peptidoglycan glycosyltransferase FtsW [Acuticoccus mangrovi]MBJ3774941.1 cell division protein FtsW [Acuticoccus mangrovi]